MIYAALILAKIVTVGSAEPPRPLSSVSEIAFDCGQHTKISFAFANDWATGHRGKVLRASISGQEVPGLPGFLSKAAKNRSIEYIVVRQCSDRGEGMKVTAEMEMSSLESKRENLSSTFFFQFTKDGFSERK